MRKRAMLARRCDTQGGALDTQGAVPWALLLWHYRPEGGPCGMKCARILTGKSVGPVGTTVRVSFHPLGRGIIEGGSWRYPLWLSVFP
jgi:hypothetical protein